MIFRRNPDDAGANARPVQHEPEPETPPKGSRTKLAASYVAALCEDFEVNGRDAIVRLRDKDPAAYLRIVAQAVPETALAHDARLDELTDDELALYLFAVRKALGAREGGVAGTSPASGANGL